LRRQKKVFSPHKENTMNNPIPASITAPPGKHIADVDGKLFAVPNGWTIAFVPTAALGGIDPNADHPGAAVAEG
jgi:hypothetical protein